MTDWKSTNITPDWKDGGKAELRYADGRIIKGYLLLNEAVSEDGDEWPVPEFTVDGKIVSFFDAEEWRLI